MVVEIIREMIKNFLYKTWTWEREKEIGRDEREREREEEEESDEKKIEELFLQEHQLT